MKKLFLIKNSENLTEELKAMWKKAGVPGSHLILVTKDGLNNGVDALLGEELQSDIVTIVVD